MESLPEHDRSVDRPEDAHFDDESVQLSPPDVVAALSRRVHGQYAAKRVLALAYQNFHHRLEDPDDLPKTNVLLPGPTGCGKTLLVSEFARITGVPLLRVNLTGISAEGYVGPSISQAFHDLAPRVSERETAFTIVHLDEFDKLAPSQGVYGYGPVLQREIIGYAEDKPVLGGKLVTKDMLFIGTGAFSGLEQIIAKRIGVGPKVGFDTEESVGFDPDTIFRRAEPEDFIAYGLMPELVGRFPRVASLDRLSERDLRGILDLRSGYLETQLRVLRQHEGVSVMVDEPCRDAIAHYAAQKGTNARAIQPAVDIVLEPYFFDADIHSGISHVLTPEFVEARLAGEDVALDASSGLPSSLRRAS